MSSNLFELLLVIFLGGLATYDTIMSKRRENREDKDTLTTDSLTSDL
ncbi:MAG TPA: hypothetical protein VLB50_11235 [Ignavibacteriaceae bacterium]|nr:hypothetical protein [Ignavibacteriaceae bacterium]